MNPAYRILFVDDEPNLLDGLRRTTRGRYVADFALGPLQALEYIETYEYDVIVSDMRMPDMDGPTFLSIVSEQRPEIVQMILSGQADLLSTVEAVNQGRIFRFMIKPVDRGALFDSLDAAIEQARLRRAEQELLEQTLGGAIDVLSTLLSVVRPESGRRSNLVQKYVSQLAGATGLADDWRLRTAMLLANVGEVTLPDELIGRSADDPGLSALQRGMIRRHPIVGGELIGRIPRLDEVAEIVRSQLGEDCRDDHELAEQIRVLRLAVDVAARVDAGETEEDAFAAVAQSGRHTAELVESLTVKSRADALAVTPEELEPEMVLCEDLVTPTGTVIAPAGTSLTPALIERISNFAAGIGVAEPIFIEISDPALALT